MAYKAGEENDNENYDAFRGKVLVVESICPTDHPAYDMGVYPQQLMDLVTEDGEDVPFALYEYEVEGI